jgi:hypothetical protein
MSALAPKADIDRLGLNVRFVPKTDIASSVRLARSDGTTAGRKGQDHRLRSLEVDRQSHFVTWRPFYVLGNHSFGVYLTWYDHRHHRREYERGLWWNNPTDIWHL